MSKNSSRYKVDDIVKIKNPRTGFAKNTIATVTNPEKDDKERIEVDVDGVRCFIKTKFLKPYNPKFKPEQKVNIEKTYSRFLQNTAATVVNPIKDAKGCIIICDVTGETGKIPERLVEVLI